MGTKRAVRQIPAPIKVAPRVTVEAAPLERTPRIVTLRIGLTAALFVGLALFGLHHLRKFGGNRLVRAVIEPLRREIAETRLHALRAHCPHRITLMDLPTTGRYQVEAYLPRPGDWAEFAGQATAPHLWKRVGEGVLDPRPEAVSGTLPMLYIHPDGRLSDRWNGPDEYEPLPTTVIEFRIAETGMALVFAGPDVHVKEEP